MTYSNSTLVARKKLSTILFILTILVLHQLPPFRQKVVPTSISCAGYYRDKGIGPIYVIDYQGEDIHFVGPYQQCYVFFLGNMALAIIPFSLGIYLWKKESGGDQQRE